MRIEIGDSLGVLGDIESMELVDEGLDDNPILAIDTTKDVYVVATLNKLFDGRTV